jgi:hypothetical protein
MLNSYVRRADVDCNMLLCPSMSLPTYQITNLIEKFDEDQFDNKI